MTVNLATYQVKVGGEPVDLTYLEYALLAFLVTHPGRTYSRDALLRRVWGFDYYGGAAPWTSTCAAFAPSSARSSLSAWRRCAASAICGTPKTRKARNVKKDCRYRRKLAHASCLPCGADAHDRQGRHPHQRRLRLPHHALQVHRNGLAGRGGVRLRRRQAGAPHRGHGPVQGTAAAHGRGAARAVSRHSGAARVHGHPRGEGARAGRATTFWAPLPPATRRWDTRPCSSPATRTPTSWRAS